MTTRFTDFEFAVTGGTEERTTPDRLPDSINVLDFGADPTGVEDSLAAFDAALEACINQQGRYNYMGVRRATLTSATISNGAGGSGDILAFSSVDNRSTLDGAGDRPIGIGFSGVLPDSLLVPETYIIDQIDETHYQLNRSLSVASTTIYVYPDPERIKSYGSIYVPRGKYLLSGPFGFQSNGIGNCISIRGESAASTMIYGDFNDFIINTGDAGGATGGSVVENLSIYNYNETPYTSGGMYNSIYNCSINSCILYGMVGLVVSSGTMFHGGAYNCEFRGPDFGLGSVGFVLCTNEGQAVGNYFTNWDIALCLGQTSLNVIGNHFYKNRIGIDNQQFMGGFQYTGNPGGIRGLGNGSYQTSNFLGNYFKSNGVALAHTGGNGQGVIAGCYVDCTPAAPGTISVSGNVQNGLDLRFFTGTAMNCFVTGGPIDGHAYILGYHGLVQTGTNCTYIGLDTDVAYDQRWLFKSNTFSYGTPSPGGHVESGNARSANFFSCGINPVWLYKDLPYAYLLNAIIVDDTLGYSSIQEVDGATFSLGGPVQWLFGTDVEPGTKLVQPNGTDFFNAIIDSGDGTGAPGNVLTFLGDPTGPTPIEGARLMIQQSTGIAGGSGYIDDGSGTMSGGLVTNTGDIYTITYPFVQCTATIKNEAGTGAGNVLTISTVTSDPGNWLQGVNVKLSRVAAGLAGAGGVPRDTFIVDGPFDGAPRKVWTINRDLNINSTTIYILQDIRVGYKHNFQSSPDLADRVLPHGSEFLEELALNQWQIDTATSAGPCGNVIIMAGFWGADVFRPLGPQLNDQQWEVTGADLNVGPQYSIRLPDTYFVNINQDTGAPQTMTFVCDQPGHTYEISDSPIPAWSIPSSTVKIMPLGDSITQGQNTSYGSYRRLLYDLLTDDGVDVDFVGTYSHGSFADPDHEGLTGDNINGAWGRIASGDRIEDFDPDVILVLIGTNDALASTSAATMLGLMDSLLNSIITHGPNVKVIVGSIPPLSNSTANGIANTFNAGLPALVASKGANFSFIDINAGLTTSDLADGIHPTDAGNDKMAYIWKPAVMAAIGTSNVGKPVTAGGGSYRVRLRFNEHLGFVIAG